MPLILDKNGGLAGIFSSASFDFKKSYDIVLPIETRAPKIDPLKHAIKRALQWQRNVSK